MDGTAGASPVPGAPQGAHMLLMCTLLLLLVVFRLILDSMKLVLPLTNCISYSHNTNCISYLIVDLAGFAPSSGPQIKNFPLSSDASFCCMSTSALPSRLVLMVQTEH